ncbi:MAG: SDR family NAD(P)-dependent oxidoreductase [Acidobacteriota bacterium]|nr:SDR family NAD(P)-dependent oxidoreductase [Acidobacteriota bacterium]
MPGQNFRGFAERVALVTGGGSGVGRAVALQLALEGVYVIVNYAPCDAEGGRVAEELREMGTLAHAVEGDVSRAVDVRRVFSAVEDAYGRLDLLVNAAGLAVGDARLDELSEEDWDTAMRLTLKGTFLCAQAAAPLLRQRPRPAMVNITAGAGDGVWGRGGNL